MRKTNRVPPTAATALRGPLRGQLERLPQGFRQIATSTGWLATEHALRMVVGLLVGVYVARHLGPAAFGVLNYALSFVFLFSALARLGLDNLVVRDLITHPERDKETLGTAFVLRLAGGTLALGLIGAVAWASQGDPTTRLAILIIAFGLIFQSLEVGTYWFYAQTLTRPVALARLVALAVASTLRIVFILLDKPVLWFAWPVMLDAALAAILSFLLFLRHSTPSVPRCRPPLSRMVSMLKDAWPLALSFGLAEVQLRIDQVMLGEMLGPNEVGWYAAAARLSQMAYVLPTLLATATFPAILRARETSQEIYNGRMQAFHDLMLWLGIGIAVPSVLLAGPAVRSLYGEAYLPTAGILQVHVWSLVFVCLGTARGRWLIAEGRTCRVLISSAIGVSSNVVFNLALIPNYGGVGAASATLLAQLASLLLLYCFDPCTRPAARMAVAALLIPVRLYARRNNGD